MPWTAGCISRFCEDSLAKPHVKRYPLSWAVDLQTDGSSVSRGVAGCDWPVASRPARRRHGRLARALGSLTSVDQTSKEKNHGIEERSADSLGYFARTKERRARLAACGGLFPLDEIQLSAARVARAWFSWFRCKGSLRG